MTLNIVNSVARNNIIQCIEDLDKIRSIIEKEGGSAPPVPFLTRYAVIKSCGTIEFCFKTIICDHTSQELNEQVRNFIDKKFRNSSMNPSMHNILGGLSSFEPAWSSCFESSVEQHQEKEKIKRSLKSLNTARNTFAHGQSINVTFDQVATYFLDSVHILELMESAILSIEREKAEAAEAAEAATTE